MSKIVKYSKFESSGFPEPDLHEDFWFRRKVENTASTILYFEYKGNEFQYIYSSRSSSLLIRKSWHKPSDLQRHLHGLQSYIFMHQSDSKIDFNEEFMEKLDNWIIEYHRFLSQFSDGHIDDIVVDFDVPILKDIKSTQWTGKSINGGWYDGLSWEILLDFRSYSKSFELSMIKEFSNFVERMESFGFVTYNKVSNGYIMITANKKII